MFYYKIKLIKHWLVVVYLFHSLTGPSLYLRIHFSHIFGKLFAWVKFQYEQVVSAFLFKECPNKHGNWLTTSISSLFLAALKREDIFRSIPFLTINIWNYWSREFQNVVYLENNGVIKKSAQISFYSITKKLLKCLISPSI